MTLEELIRAWFTGNDAIAGRLALYAGSPAVFLQAAPSDVGSEWEGRSQYPRIVFSVDMLADMERKSQGVLRVGLYCDLAHDAPEDIEPLIREALRDILMQPDEGSPYLFAWQRTEAFELESRDADKRIAGYDIAFDILEYPDQFTMFPDPAESLSLWLKALFPDAFVIGADKADHFREATKNGPLLYVRAESYQNDHTSMALAWINCRLAVHVIAPDASSRSQWVRAISTSMMVAGDAPLTDGTPLRFTGVQASNGSDYLTAGQIMLSAQFTLPRPQRGGDLLRHVTVKEAANE